MRFLLSVSLCIFLLSCSSNETVPSVENTLGSSDGLSSTEPTLTSDPLATPVDITSSSPTTPEQVSTLTPPTPPAPESAAPVTATSGIPEPKVVSIPNADSPKEKSAAKKKWDAREQYSQYQEEAQQRAENALEYEDRVLFPHEGGAMQFGMDYGLNSFEQFDFEPGEGKKYFNTTGGILSLSYFPLRSLSFGRLGLGAVGGAYWTRYEHFTGISTNSNKKLSMTTYGGKLVYEFQYLLGQTFVPFLHYGYDSVKVKPYSLPEAGVSYPSRRFSSQYYGGGAHLNLNRLESSTASEALASSGIRKFYLTYSLLQRIEEAGTSHSLGLRFEF